MKNIVTVYLSLLLVMAFSQKGVSQSTNQPTTGSEEGTIQRVVCFKFKPGISPEAIQEHLQGLAALKDSIPAILSYQAGTVIQGEQRDKSEYDVMHYFTFRTEADIKLYYDHPAHARFAKKNGTNWEKFFIVNTQLHPQLLVHLRWSRSVLNA